jgi:hypothetical protein
MFFSFAGKVRRRLRLMQPTPFRARKDGEGSGDSRGQLPSLKLYAAVKMDCHVEKSPN